MQGNCFKGGFIGSLLNVDGCNRVMFLSLIDNFLCFRSSKSLKVNKT